jgi:glutamate-ammonia-ligase adenylyltransferase
MRGTGVRHGIDWAEGLALARNHTTFLARALDRQPDLAALLAQGRMDEALAWARQAGSGAADVGVALRRERSRWRWRWRWAIWPARCR